ncbi:metallophosphoesterase [Planococcus sp. ISL-110]|uniref:metallophosphoesterase n=1 Tax=Planococcus sp. ISL-110 TaxID=2819167 RepID=UPI001BE9B94B|nr:metallophosphoesterase [Planococcus sp. ISL-110]MBT2569312.1 metallophosphoesterase [Planococcus sp. ISL-110]
MKLLAGISGALLIYMALIAYLGWTVYSWLTSFADGLNPWIFTAFWLIVAFSYIIGRIGHKWLGFTILGSYWFAFLQYAILLIPVANIIVLLVDFKDDVFIIGCATAAILLVIFIIGTYLAYSPIVRTLEVTVDGEEAEPLHMVIGSDFHLGVLSGKSHLKRFVEKTNALDPDVVFLAGDLVDDDPVWYARYGMGEVMEQLKPRLGVYGVLGNHEYYGKKIPLLVRLMEKSGVNILRDETILVANRFYLTGREDRTNGNRHSLLDLKPEKGGLPWIVMDHTPSDLKMPVELGADFHMSGHTHKGQMWPNHLLTKKIFELDYGYRLIRETHFIVSSGFGFWGPPLRLGSRSELWSVTMNFRPSS